MPQRGPAPSQPEPPAREYPPTMMGEPVVPELRREREPEPYLEPEPRRYRDPEPPRDRYRDRESRDRYRDEPYESPREPEPPPRRRDYADREPRFHGPSADSIGRAVQVFSGLISLAFVLHIIFVVAGANHESGFVAFVYSVAKFFVFGLGDVFTPGDPTIGVVLNYGLAALVYLALGRIIARALRR